MKKYFYAINQVQFGPFSLDKILSKNLDKDTLVWFEGLAEWVRLSEIPDLITKSNESLPLPIMVKENDTGKKKFPKFYMPLHFQF